MASNLLEKRPLENALENLAASKKPRLDSMHDSEILRQEYIRLLEQALVGLGYEDAAKVLEKQSGVPLQPKAAEDLRNFVLAGDWNEAVACVDLLALEDPRPAKFLLLEHKFIETLAAGDLGGALSCLRNELTPLAYKSQSLPVSKAPAANGLPQPPAVSDSIVQRVQQLATCLLLPSPAALRAATGWAGPEEGSRERALHDLQALLPPQVMPPDCRLQVLLAQALELQLQRCSFFNSSRHVSLLADLASSREDMPSEVLAVLTDHQDEVWFAEFSGDGRLLATASRDKSVIVYRMDGPTQFTKLHTLLHDSVVSFLAFSPRGTRLLTSVNLSPNQQTILLWDAETGTQLRRFEAPKAELGRATFYTPNYDASTQGPYVSWLAKGRHFVSGPHGDRNNSMLVWDADSGTEVLRIKCAARPHDFTTSRCGRFLLACCSDKKMRIWDLATQQEVVFGGGETMMTVVLSNSVGDHLLVAFQNQKVEQWDLERTFRRAADEAAGRGEAGIASGSLGPGPGSPLLPVVTPLNFGANRGPEAGPSRSAPQAEPPAPGLGPAPSQPIRTLKGLPERSARYILRPAFFGFRQSFIAMGAEDSLIYVWNRSTGELLDTLEGHTGTVNSVAAHPTEPGLLVSSSDDKSVIVWGAKSLLAAHATTGTSTEMC